MLQKLTIKNVALINCAEINFFEGLNVLSGETGAGKSVIIESLNFVLGAKADRTLIRNGESECLVKAEFDVSNNDTIFSVYDEFDFDKEDLLIISRKFNLDGKSSIKINGNSATVNMLKKFTSALVDVHGQSEHFNLLKLSNQLSLLDKIGGDEISHQKNIVKDIFSKYKEISLQLDELGGDESQRLIRLDILNYQINEIINSSLSENEEEELLFIKQKLIHQEKIFNALNSVKCAINEDGGVSDTLSNVSKSVGSISSFANDYSLLYDRLDSIITEIDDLADSANSLLDGLDVSDYDADKIESRLEQIKTLKNKYGSSYADIMAFYNNAIEERDRLENFNENAKNLLESFAKLKDEFYKQCTKLSNIRRKVANSFSDNIVAELQELGMPKAKFSIDFDDLLSIDDCKFTSNGIDSVEFKFSANAGEPLKPLSMVISGGEMSRFMLAIKSQTAKFNEVDTFIFDEIDSGISGNVAKIVAEKFARISKDVQVIAITHLPQISAMADNNMFIEKVETAEKTLTMVKKLNDEEKVFEIVRLVGGDKNSQTSINHAKEIIATANKFKNSITN